jgi:hypothetical protein
MFTMRNHKWLLAMAVLLVPAAALAADEPAYPEAYAERPLVLNRHMGEVGLDFTLGLNAGRAAKDMALGLGFRFAVIDNFEIGLGVDALKYSADVYDAKFGGFDVFARYAFLQYLGVELHIFAPGDRFAPRGSYIDSFGDQLVGIEVGVPFQYIIVHDMLKVHAGLAFDLGFMTEGRAGQTPQFSIGINYGIAFNPIKQVFLDLYSGALMCIRPDAGSFGDRVAIPLGLIAGGTLVGGSLDLFLKFQFDDLKGAQADARSLGVGGRFRF